MKFYSDSFSPFTDKILPVVETMLSEKEDRDTFAAILTQTRI